MPRKKAEEARRVDLDGHRVFWEATQEAKKGVKEAKQEKKRAAKEEAWETKRRKWRQGR
jgi:hypothetical protein